MNPLVPVSGVVGFDLSYSSLLPTVSLVVDGLCVVLLIGAIAALVASVWSSTHVLVRGASEKPARGKLIFLARSRTP